MYLLNFSYETKIRREEHMSKEEQNKQPRRNLNTPGYTAIHGYANSINQFVQFLQWHWLCEQHQSICAVSSMALYLGGGGKDAMDSVLMKTDVVKNLCQQKVDLNKIYKYISN